jgi:hypothetical protein
LPTQEQENGIIMKTPEQSYNQTTLFNVIGAERVKINIYEQQSDSRAGREHVQGPSLSTA